MQDQEQLKRDLLEFKAGLTEPPAPIAPETWRNDDNMPEPYPQSAATEEPTQASELQPRTEPRPKPGNGGRKATRQHMDADTFIRVARDAVSANYNEHRKSESRASGDLLPSEITLVWCSKVLGNWKAQFGSINARGLLWEVSLSGVRQELYVDVFSKLNTVRISLTGNE